MTCFWNKNNGTLQRFFAERNAQFLRSPRATDPCGLIMCEFSDKKRTLINPEDAFEGLSVSPRTIRVEEKTKLDHSLEGKAAADLGALVGVSGNVNAALQNEENLVIETMDMRAHVIGIEEYNSLLQGVEAKPFLGAAAVKRLGVVSTSYSISGLIIKNASTAAAELGAQVEAIKAGGELSKSTSSELHVLYDPNAWIAMSVNLLELKAGRWFVVETGKIRIRNADTTNVVATPPTPDRLDDEIMVVEFDEN